MNSPCRRPSRVISLWTKATKDLPNQSTRTGNDRLGRKPIQSPESRRKVSLAANALPPVVKRTPRHHQRKTGQSYYYEYYFYCPNCRTLYLIEDAKRVYEGQSSPNAGEAGSTDLKGLYPD